MSHAEFQLANICAYMRVIKMQGEKNMCIFSIQLK